MWLTFHNKILTKEVLKKKQWQGDTHYHLCLGSGAEETSVHLFLKCPYVSQIWFWMGNFQNYYIDWQLLKDIQLFVLTMPPCQRQSILMVISAIFWSIWKTWNSICFDNKHIPTIQQMVLLTCSFLNYWTGAKRGKALQYTHFWTPADMDMVPLQTMSPSPVAALEMASGNRDPLVPLLLAN